MDTVIKRDGTTVPFDKQKIFNVIGKANNVVKDKESMSFTDILYVTNKVVAEIEKRGVSHVEEIQDVVIDMLIKYEYPETSKEYIIYRSEHNKIRNSEIDLMDIYNKLTFVDSKDIDIKRENANIDGNTAMGTMLKYGSEGSKYFVDNYVLPKDISLAHASGEIHIHDKDFYMLTETCCQIDLLKLFKNGFSTGHGYLREPNSIESYSALACIAIQANQNEMHGGQSVPNFDYAMAPGIVKTYKSEFKRAFATYLQVEAVSRELPTDEPFNADDITDILETFMFLDKFNEAQNVAEVDALMTDLIALIESDTTGKLISWMYKSSDLHEKYPNLSDDDLKITMDGFIDILKKAIPFSKQEALARTDRRCYQAMEALVHNLNTMSSRAGAQVPFSSLNYGTDISPEGRMVIKNILLSTEAGLGNGETSIFPVQIFKLKEGVNYNTEDPNYDLFKLSMRVSAKRLFPNYSFLDSPFNKQYYDGSWDSEVAYMGCVVPWSHVNYKIDDSVGMCTPIDELFDKTQLMHGSIVSACGNSEYVDVSDKHVSIFDTKSGTYVKVKKVIRNRYNGMLKRIRGSAGRVVEITPDHPLPVNGKGRVRADELIVGDTIQLADNVKPVAKSNIIDDPDMAWLLGLIICDGSYANNIVISVGIDETDIIDKVKYVCDKYGYCISISEQHRGIRGNYFDINLILGMQLASFRLKLALLFRGIRKVDRRVPECIMTADDDIRSAFLAGMIDADGYLYNNKSTVYSLGSTNQYLAYGEFQLANSLGLVARMYTNNYTPLKEKLRYNNEFDSSELINSYIACTKKKITDCVYVRSISYPDTRVNSIEDFQYAGYVYDVETESDTFDFNGICSHNCRTRVIGNIHDPSRQTTAGRGNLSFTTINLPRIALELMNKDLSQEEKIDEFFRILDTRIDLVFRQLIHRLKIQSNKQVKNYPFLMGEGIWMDSDKLGMDDKIGEILKHGTLTIGFIGLAETLVGLIGKHHGESEEAQELGLKIVGHLRERCDEESEKTKLNFSLIATPAESLSGRFVNIDKKKYGEIPGVTDKSYYTNSNHIPVYYPIKAFQKIKLEAPYHAFCNAGHIAYTELDGDPSQNLEAFESVIRYMHDCGIGYGSINHPVDRDPVCGYVGVINDVCPRCGRREGEELSDEQMEALRRKYGRAIPTRCC